MIWLYICIALGIVLTIAVGFGIYFFNFSENPSFSKKKLFKNKKETPYASEKDNKWIKKVVKKDWIIISFDKLLLHGYAILNKGNKWVIIIHGYTNEAMEMTTPAHKFYDMGYNVLLIDQRAHGKSGGKYSSMGWIERKDIVEWVKYLVNENPKAQIILYGVSMGGSTVMMSVGEKLPTNVIGAIEDCGFLSIYHQFYVQLKYLKFMPRPIIWLGHLFAKVMIKFNIYKADGLKQLQKGKIPMLFIHGENDRFVPISNFYEALENYNGYKEKLIVKNAKHMRASTENPTLYWQTIEDFIKKITLKK